MNRCELKVCSKTYTGNNKTNLVSTGSQKLVMWPCESTKALTKQTNKNKGHEFLTSYLIHSFLGDGWFC